MKFVNGSDHLILEYCISQLTATSVCFFLNYSLQGMTVSFLIYVFTPFTVYARLSKESSCAISEDKTRSVIIEIRARVSKKYRRGRQQTAIM